jgi:hypothetical protein
MLARHPRPDICGAVLEHNTPARFVLSQDPDCVTIREHQIGKIQHKDTAGWLCIDYLAQLVYTLGVKLTADREHDRSAAGAMNFQHRPHRLLTQVPGHSRASLIARGSGRVARRDFANGERRHNTDSRMLWRPRAKAAFVDLQRSNLRFKRRTRNSESRGRPRWPKHSSFGGPQCVFDQRLLV